VQTLANERRTAGAFTTGLVLTLVTIVDERMARVAMEAAAAGAAAHPCRLLVVIRRQPNSTEARLDAEVTVGGHLGAGESVVLRVYGDLGSHAESVVLPLLAPDTPVVTWWYGPPPATIEQDPLGRLADRRITDAAAAPDPVASLRDRAAEYSPGDTDLAWSRITPWRSLLASAFDSVDSSPRRSSVTAEADNPSAHLLAAWIRHRLGVPTTVETSGGPGITEVAVEFDDGPLRIGRPDGHNATIERPGAPERFVPLARRSTGDLLGEELRRLDADEPYAETLTAFARPDDVPEPPETVEVRGGAARGGEPAGVDVPASHALPDASGEAADGGRGGPASETATAGGGST
jgi:glucose-6-phosphate dehydrogenase assembly protein OpcA